jgi:curved DNA-binding protein CbpA
MKKTGPDYYEVLGIRRDASLAALKQAYRDLVRRYHPDAAGNTAEARAQFERLQEAYEILSNPDKRAKYDATLPPRKYPAQELDAEGLWREATDLLFERSDSFSSLLQTMRLAVPIALEGNMLIVGVAGKDQYLAGHLSIPGNRYRVIEALREVSGQDIDYRVIEGTTQQDWRGGDPSRPRSPKRPHARRVPPPGLRPGPSKRRERPRRRRSPPGNSYHARLPTGGAARRTASTR